MRMRRLVWMVLVGVLALLVFSAASALAVEVPITEPATSITGDSAILHGELNPNAPGEPVFYKFDYRRSSESCTEGEGTEFVESLGHEKEAVEALATDEPPSDVLEPGAMYTFCLVTLQNEEITVGAPLKFQTLPNASPSVGYTAAEGVTPFEATLSSYINPEKLETSYEFKYATNKAMTGAQTIKGAAPFPGVFEHKQVTAQTPATLEPDTTYYFQAIATNSDGTTPGPVVEFTTLTPEPPIFESEEASKGSSLRALLNPNYQETSYSFEYATNESLTENLKVAPGAPPAPDLPGIFKELPAGPVTLSGLQPGRTYYYRVVATNTSSQLTDGPVESFVADAAPAVATNPTEAPTRTSTPASGTIIPQGLATTYHFAYTPTAEYEPSAANPYAHGKNTHETKLTEENGESILGYTPQPVGLTLQELKPGTTYDYALIASNELGTTIGPNQTFTTTPPTPPLVSTGPAEAVSQLSAVITGTVNTQGLQTTEHFEFGPTPYAGALKPVTVVTSTGTIDTITHAFTNDLQPGTTYYYRVIASSQDGEVDGAEQSFTTPGFPAAFPAATVLPAVPYTSLAVLQAKEAKEGKASAPKALTRAQKLARALRGCRRERGSRRVGCERTAHRQYGAANRKRAKR